MDPLKIAFLGCGGIGGYYGARLVQAQQRVTFLVRPLRAAHLADHGLVVQTPTERFTLAKVSTVTTASPSASSPDLVVLTCKAYDLEAAIASVEPWFSDNSKTLLLPLLNGVRHYDRLDEKFGPQRVVGGTCHIMAELDKQGVVRQGQRMNRITFGLRPGNASWAGDVLRRLHKAFSETPVDTRFSETVMQDIWEKYVLIASLAGMTCLARASVGTISSTSEGKSLILRMAHECMNAAALSGFAMRPHALAEITQRLTEADSVLTSSMLRDILAGNLIESDHIVGDMLQRLRRADPKADCVMLQMASCHLQSYNLVRARNGKL